ncbi:MAG: D-glycerate dehydrogenase [Pseudomonadota bacterium]
MTERPKLLLTRNLPPQVTEGCRAHFDVTAPDRTMPFTPDEMVAALGAYDAILPTLGDMFSAEVFARADRPRTRILANFGVGYNHIDVAAARAAGLEVTNTPGAVTDATADIALMLMLMAARRAGEGERLVRSGEWTGWHPVQMLGQHVSGKTLGLVGYGRIGKAVARRAHFGFGMPVIAYTRSPVEETELTVRQYTTLPEMMAAADFVVVAVPGGAQTRHLVGTEALAAMKPTGILVNIARGDVIDEAALIDTLAARRIAAAGLDVYEGEPEVPDALRALDNAVLLPHLGTAVLDVRTAMGLMALDNLRAFFDGRPVPNPVT